MFLTKERVKVLKGVGILMMVTLHLFGFPSWLKSGNEYIPILKFYNLEFVIAKFCGMVVGFYLFLSGYGLEKSYHDRSTNYKECLNRILSLYKEYLIVFIPFTMIGYIFYNLRFNGLLDLFYNVSALKPSTNVFVWFIRLYVQFLLLFPIIKKILDSKNRKIAYFIPIFIYIGTVLNAGFFYFFPSLKWFRETFYYELLYSFGSWQLLFCLGYLFSKDNIYERVLKILNKKVNLQYLGIFGVLISFLLRESARNIGGGVILFDIFMVDQIVVPWFIFFITLFLDNFKFLREIFFRLGKYSTTIWLIHCYFILDYFQKVIYYPKLSILVLIWSFVIFIGVSKLIYFVRKIF